MMGLPTIYICFSNESSNEVTGFVYKYKDPDRRSNIPERLSRQINKESNTWIEDQSVMRAVFLKNCQYI